MPNNPAKRILSTMGDFLSSFITATVVLVAILSIVIRLLGWHMFSVDSPSMSPHYPVNTLIIVQSTAPEDIQPGDVITYVLREDGVLVTHRVVAVHPESKTFTTKGDANQIEDALPVRWDNMVGKVLLGIPWLGRPVQFLTAEGNRPLVMSLIAALFFISCVWHMRERTIQKKRVYEKDIRLPTESFDGDKPPFL